MDSLRKGNDLKSTVGKAVAAVGETWIRVNKAREDGAIYEVGYTDGEDSENEGIKVLMAFGTEREADDFRNDVAALRLGHAAIAAIKESGYELKEVEKPFLIGGVPVDNPRFNDPGRVNDWRSEVGGQVAVIWDTLTTKQRRAIAQDADFRFQANKAQQ